VSERFFDELTELLEVVATFRSQVIVTGDFNVHVNDPTDRHANRLAELLTTFNMQQAVTQPRHTGGNTLHLVITRSDGRPSNCSVDPPNIISDHSLIVCDFPSIPFAVRRVTQTCRPWKKMDRAAFNMALLSSPLCTCSEDELRHMTSTELFDVYDATLRQIADDHAPASTTVRRIRPLSRWFDSDCRKSRRKTRQLNSSVATTIV